MRLKIAIRNVFRNKRRTLLNVFMIAGGVVAMVVFKGMTQNIVTGLREATIKTQTGHLQIATAAFWNKTARAPKDALIHDYAKVQKKITRHPLIRSASGRLTFFGLVSAGDQSTSAQGISFDPRAEGNVNRSYKFVAGRGFTGAKAYEIVLGSILAGRLGAKVGDQLTVLANTFDGVVNALDFEVVGLFVTNISAVDERTFLIPLSLAQKLMDTPAVEQIIVNLKETQDTDGILGFLQKELGEKLQVKPWYDVAPLYQQVKEFNRVQSIMLECIIVSLVLLGVLNTIGMSVFERTGEIGTIAALGERGSTILGQFVLEGTLLGFLGSIVGVGLGLLARPLINGLGIELVIPGATEMLVIHLDYTLVSFLTAATLSVFAAALASIVPAFRASRMNIANALRHNI